MHIAMKRAEQTEAKQQWQKKMVEGQLQSGLSIKEYCARHGITQASFYVWKRRVAAGRVSAGFSEVHVEGAARPASAPVELVISGSYRVSVPRDFDEVSLTRLVRLLEGLV
jgi:transposase